MSARPGSGGPDVHRANEPTASLMSVQVQNLHASDYHLLDGERGKTMLLRSARTIGGSARPWVSSRRRRDCCGALIGVPIGLHK